MLDYKRLRGNITIESSGKVIKEDKFLCAACKRDVNSNSFSASLTGVGYIKVVASEVKPKRKIN